MKKCKICGCTLTAKRTDLNNILNKHERNKLEKIRIDRQLCSECSLTLAMLNLL